MKKQLVVSISKSRNINIETIKNFRMGYSFNKKFHYKYLKDHSFADDDLLKSNVVKFIKKKNQRLFL